MKTYFVSLSIMALPVWLPLVTSVPLGVVLFPALALSTYLFYKASEEAK